MIYKIVAWVFRVPPSIFALELFSEKKSSPGAGPSPDHRAGMVPTEAQRFNWSSGLPARSKKGNKLRREVCWWLVG